MSPAQAKTHFAVTIDKRLTLGAVASTAMVLILIGWNASNANGRITSLESKAATIGEVNERTIRIEEQIKAIRERLDRGH